MFFKTNFLHKLKENSSFYEGKLKVNFFPYEFKTIEFGCKRRLDFLRGRIIPLKVMDSPTSIMRTVKKDSLRNAVGITLKKFSLFDKEFVEAFKIIEAKKTLISVELIEKNTDLDLLKLDFLMSVAIFGFAFGDIINKIEFQILNSNSGSEATLGFDVTLKDDSLNISFLQEDTKANVNVVFSKAEVELAVLKSEKETKLLSEKCWHCSNCDFTKNCY